MARDDYDDPSRLYFFLDFISHNVWLAWYRIGAIADRHGLTLEPVPVLFGGLLKAHGQLGPAEVPPKSRWMIGNVLRKAQRDGIPIAPPASHPFNPLLALRVACCERLPAQRVALCDRLFRAAWVESRALQSAEVVAEVLREAGLDADAVLQQAAQPAAKDRLRINTETALQAGVFGVPAMRVRGQLFWGYDDLADLSRFLEGEPPLSAEQLAPWLQVRPSTQRPR
jgi:2-hydroxychromene-2-carboxylate isomerase